MPDHPPSQAAGSGAFPGAPNIARRRAFSAPALSFRTEGDPALADSLRQALTVPPLPARIDEAQRAELEAKLYTHLFHSFAGRMHPLTVRALLSQLPHAPTVLDPFVGSGTVLIETALAGGQAIGSDISELALRLSRFKATPLPARMGRALVELAHAVAERSLARVQNRTRPKRYWDKPQYYPPHVYLELCGLREEIELAKQQDGPLGEALLLLFSSIVVKASRQRAESAPHRIEPHIGPGQPTRWFSARADEVSRLHSALWTHTRIHRPPAPLILPGDARTLFAQSDLPIWPHSVDAVITSPPYLGTFDYVDHHARRYPWLDIDAQGIAEAEMAARRHAEDMPLHALAQRHQRDTDAWLAGVAPLLKPAGKIFVLVGDSLVAGEHVAGDLPIRAAASRAGFRLAAGAAVERPHFFLPEKDLDPRALTPRFEHLLLFVRATSGARDTQ